MAHLDEAWTRTVAGVPVKDFSLVLKFPFVVVAAPLASACHACFPMVEVSVSLIFDALVSFLVLVLAYIVYGFVFLAAVAFVRFAVLLLYPSPSSW